MGPTFGNGKICYIVIPAKNVQRSAAFYRDVFDWNIRTRNDGSVSFEDGVGEVSGTWTTELQPMQPGVTVHIMVDDAEQTLEKVAAHGGEIVEPLGSHPPEITALIRDPGGNILGIYQHRGRVQPAH